MNSINFKTNSFLLIAAFLLFFSACSNSDKYATEIRLLDSVLVKLDSAELKFNSVDISRIKQYALKLDSNLNYFNTQNKDTLTKETAILISEYRSAGKPFKVIISQYKSLETELPESKKQIENLLHDLKKNKADDAKALFYVQNEVIAARRIIHTIDNMENLVTLYSEKFELYGPEVNELVNALKEKSESQNNN